VPAAALVRPDGVLAWKAGASEEAAHQLRSVMSVILAAAPTRRTGAEPGAAAE